MIEAPIVCDIWGGKNSMDHIARFVRPLEDVLPLIRIELARGYLVNLRADADFGPIEEFDARGAVQ